MLRLVKQILKEALLVIGLKGCKGIPRQSYPCNIPLKFCKEAGSNLGPPGHKWRISTAALGPTFISSWACKFEL